MADPRFAFTHAGRQYVMVPWREWPLSVMLDVERGAISGLASVFAVGDFDQLVADGFTVGQLHDVIDAANKTAQAVKDAADAAARR